MSETSLTLIDIARTVLQEGLHVVEVFCEGEEDGWIRPVSIEEFGRGDVWLITRSIGGRVLYVGSEKITAVRTIPPVSLVAVETF